MGAATCSVGNCTTPARARGWCGRHYQRWCRTGDPEGSTNLPRRDRVRHGSRRAYRLGCRCFPCRIAENRYQEAWRAGQLARVDAAVVAAHLRMLVASGWTQVGIADEAGVARTTPWHILDGRVRKVNRRTAEALFTVEPLRTVVLDAGPLVAAVEALRTPIVHLLAGTDRRAFYRARESGQVTDRAADRIAVAALGLTLDEVYGPAWDEVAA